LYVTKKATREFPTFFGKPVYAIEFKALGIFNLMKRRHFSTGALSNALRWCKMSRYCHGINTGRDDIFNGGGNCLSAPLSHHLDLQPALPLM
jgi:hypothetical protein